MKKRIRAFLTGIIVLSQSFNSCTAALEEHTCPDEGASAETSRLMIHVPRHVDTRSSISPDEERINSIYVMAYRKSDGILAAAQTGTSPEDIDMELTRGKYDIYITANMKGFQAPTVEGELHLEHYAVRSLSQMGDGLPMCWKGEATLKPGKNTILRADMSRLVSKIGIKIDMGSIKDLDIKSVRLCQGAGRIWPFMKGGSRIDDPSDAIDGDYASTEDLRRLMAGETIWLYATENCQGTLLPENTDPWAKIPDNLGSSAGLCTYIEMVGEWAGSSAYQGTVTYRFYLGGDTVSDFNIRRNSINCITIYLEKGSFGKVNWKIDTSQMDPVNWNMSSSLENNFHDRDNFHVTENIRVDFSFDSDGRLYWQNRNNSFIIAGLGSNGKTVIRFEDPVDHGDGCFHAIGTCIGEGYYDIVLMDRETGEIKYLMEYGHIRIPEVVAGPPGFYSDKEVKRFSMERNLYINGKEVEVCLYLTDSKGYNINQADYYGCDLTLPEWSASFLSNAYDYNMEYGILTSMETGESGSGSYAARYTFRIGNDGKQEEWNSRLSRNLGPGTLDIRFEDRFSEASGDMSMGLYCDNIYVKMMCVPETHRSHLQSEFMYAVENTSNLPVKIRGLKLNSMETVPVRSDVRTVACELIPDFASTVPLLISRLPYTYCSLETDSARSDMIDGNICFAAEDNGIEQSQIPSQLAMFHTVEAELAYATGLWSPPIRGHIDLYDTDEHIRTYGPEGYTNCGIAFHSGDYSYIQYDKNNGTKTNFSEYGGLLGKDYIGKFNDIIEVDFSINEKNEIIATSSRKVELNVSISGKLNGHIRCVTVRDPFYTLWGRYYVESVPFDNSETFSLGSSPSVVDAGTLAKAFQEMRNIEYYSVVDAMKEEEFRVNDHQDGTIREYLKPYGIDLSIDITSADGTPVAVRFSGSAVYDYKISAPVTWAMGILKRVTMVPSSYSDFDKGLDDNGCPPGELFKAEIVYLQPELTIGPNPGLYYMGR